eukprot:scaffold121554_cov42-Phaeocystis_antarctica.AAC.1
MHRHRLSLSLRRRRRVDQPQPAVTVASVVDIVDARELHARVHVRRVGVRPVVDVRPRRTDRNLILALSAAGRHGLQAAWRASRVRQKVWQAQCGPRVRATWRGDAVRRAARRRRLAALAMQICGRGICHGPQR